MRRNLFVLAIVAPLALALGIVSARLSRALDTVDHQRDAIRAEIRADAQSRHVLAELCKTNEIIFGLVKASESLFEYETGILPPPAPGSLRDHPNAPPGQPLVSKKLVPVYLRALKTFVGWEGQLGAQTACRTITRP